MNFGSLFSGIGGIDLGLERAGMQCRWQCEINDACNLVLAEHWPDVARIRDVRDVCLGTVEAIDLICAGFPCQPVSVAGQRKGQGDHRWLWPEVARVVDELRPAIVLLENVPGLLTLGGAEVVSDLATLGYDAEWHCFPASAIGAYHRRNRWWCVAADTLPANGREIRIHERKSGLRQESGSTGGHRTIAANASGDGWEPRRAKSTRQQGRPDAAECGPSPADAQGDGWTRHGNAVSEQRPSGESGIAPRLRQELSPDAIRPRLEVGKVFGGDLDEELAAAFRTHRGPGGIWETFSTVGCLASGVSRRVEQLSGYGNAVVPQCAEFIGRRILLASVV